jgi:acyl carrier protein
MLNEEVVRANLRQFLATEVLFSKEFSFGDDTSLVEEGIVDSLGVVNLVMYVKAALGVEVEASDINPSNFDSVNNIVGYVMRKRAVTDAVSK